MSKHEVDFETTVLDYLSQRRGVRRERLIEYLIESHPDETGYSIPSINRKLANMHKAGLILIENDPGVLAQYAIEKEDGKASYVLTRSSSEIIKHLDYVFDNYKSGNSVVKNTALKEIKKYNMISFFNPSHLDILVLDLDNEDDDLINTLLEILYNQVINKENEPGSKKIFLEKLRNLLKRYPEGHKKYSMLRRRVIWLLGYYNDKAVLEQLKTDIKAGRLSEFKNDYLDKFTARVIEEGRTELFDLEIKLRKEGDKETADTLAEIRNQALDKARRSIESNELFEAVFGSPVPKSKTKGKVKRSKK